MSKIVNEGNPRVVPSYAPVSASELPARMPYGPVNGVEVIDNSDTDGLAEVIDIEDAEAGVIENDGDEDTESARVQASDAPDGDAITPEGANQAAGQNGESDAGSSEDSVEGASSLDVPTSGSETEEDGAGDSSDSGRKRRKSKNS